MAEDNVILPGTGQTIATKARSDGAEVQQVQLVDDQLQSVHPADADDLKELVGSSLQTSEDNISVADLLLKAMSKEEAMRLQVDLPQNLKQEADGSLLLADMKGPYNWISKDANQPFFIDCTGYLTMIVQKSTAGIVMPYASNDNQNWIQTMALSVVGSTALSTTIVTTAGIYILPVLSRYMKLVGPASAIQCTIYLSRQPFNPMQSIINEPTNITQIQGVNVPAAAAAANSNPMPMAGADALAIPLTRRLLTDALGRLQIGTHPSQLLAGVRMVNFDPTYRNILEVQDTSKSSDESQSVTELLWNILAEIRITNWFLFEGFKGTPILDEPPALRNDSTMIGT